MPCPFPEAAVHARETADRDVPLRIISSMAPIRIADFGGWTDTWFAKHGRVLNIAVYPHAEVQIRVYRRSDGRPPVAIYAENYGARYTLEHIGGTYDRHPLLEAAIEYMGVPQDLALEIDIFSEAPVGCSTGTSASVSVALIGALDLLSPGRLTPHEVARAAHRIETELLKQQCGVQDQLASAYGGVNFIEILDYPHAIVSPISLPPATLWELEARLSLVFLGQSHSSSKVHQSVIAELEDAGPDAPKLQPLRETPIQARDALYAADFHALGRTMIANTDAQVALHALEGERRRRRRRLRHAVVRRHGRPETRDAPRHHHFAAQHAGHSDLLEPVGTPRLGFRRRRSGFLARHVADVAARLIAHRGAFPPRRRC
jgi:D-glycero-alpha-D-manno-heptose-7-phosphate kinase